jgi:hypothetical protein
VGITAQPVPILKTTKEKLKALKLQSLDYGKELFTVDVTDVAQKSKMYSEYKEQLQSKKLTELTFLGIAFAGPSKFVTSLTGNLGLLK